MSAGHITSHFPLSISTSLHPPLRRLTHHRRPHPPPAAAATVVAATTTHVICRPHFIPPCVNVMASAVPAAPRAAPSLTSPSPMPLVSTRADPQHQRNSAMDVQRDSTMDVKMADGDDDPLDDVSDADSATSESHRPSRKKKKGQRFFCTDYPPCQLSFTRSEHLARHIR